MNNHFHTYTYKLFLLNGGIKKTLFFILFAIVLSACKQQKQIVSAKPKCDIDFKSAKQLAEQLKNNEFKFNTFDAKMDVTSVVDSSQNTFITSLRIKKDSIIWISISKVGIEAARVLISKDSVKMIDRLNNQYFKGDYIYLSKLLNFQLDYEILQSLLVGNSVSFYDDDTRLKANIKDCQYLLGTIRKHKLKKVMEKGKELNDPAQSIYLNPETFKIIRILFYNFDLNRSFDASFSHFAIVDSTQLFPTKINYSIKAQKNISIDINYKKQKINEEITFPFKIPANYEEIIFKEK